ncbi:MAG: glycosyltransferase family 39 protein [Bacteroidales bacterium]|nr:glycosyltransferase family 39 protein [Bacteroidales bacterium]
MMPSPDTFLPLRQVKQLLVAVCLMLPSLLIPTGNSHEWGDDYAQYIHQGINISRGIAQTDCGYIFHPDNAMLGPHAYPPGFPLMLAGVFELYGNYTSDFVFFMFLLTLMTAVLAYLYFRQFFSHLTALALMLFLFYNPWVMNFRNEVMADIPFTLLLLLFLLLWPFCKKWWHFLLAGLLAGFTISVKEVGWALCIAAMHSIFIQRVNAPFDGIKSKGKWVRGLVFLLSTLAVWYIIEIWLFHIPRPYDENFVSLHILRNVMDNLDYYPKVLQTFFYNDSGEFNFIPTFFAPLAFAFVVMGLYRSFVKGLGLKEWLVMIYFAVLVIYPYHSSGFRFLLPIAPVLMIYMAEGLKAFQPLQKWSLVYKFYLFIVLVGLQYSLSYSQILYYSDKVRSGPQEPLAVQMFEFMKQGLPENSRVVFAKPRALALYTPFSALALHPNSSPHLTDSLLRSYDIHYALLCSDLVDNALRDYLMLYPQRVQKIRTNAKFELYEIIKIDPIQN